MTSTLKLPRDQVEASAPAMSSSTSSAEVGSPTRPSRRPPRLCFAIRVWGTWKSSCRSGETSGTTRSGWRI